ncbi:endonuclease domain-containing protein [Legionella sp. 27fs60]|uniref:Endonuclease domain-containing protein n=2 Tax=Legionella bononiensis TaxID=2793102 RepID=A0ABS1WDE1_9GAMM|nr:endonuclease domain-containing protein [Legionella bononiensis]MBL7527329.1 endonuclease domain-containing protein [Legionella bononiensis]MBL7562298.1 endonuclease domain-containing protein [Legionella bononiensis]
MQELARNRRKNQTNAENRMWYYLRNRRLGGYKFVREQVIGQYIADFVCRESKLIIEVDGGQHMAAEAYDHQRTKDLEAVGYRVMRVWNNEVFSNIQGVMERILSLLEGGQLIRNPHPQPFSLKREKGGLA